METLQLIGGLLIIVLTFFDFFHTTLSGKGFGWGSKALNLIINRIIIQDRERTIFRYSGLVHLLIQTTVWLSLLILGTFLVFTSGEEMVIGSSDNLPATLTERFYFTCYLLSTLGIGDFIPGNEISEIIAGILSFSGFVLITTGLTYFLSVINAVLSKKQFALHIYSFGGNIEELYDYFKKDDEISNLTTSAGEFRQQTLKNASSYLAFPMVNYFLTTEKRSELTVQLAALYEVMNVLRMEWKEDSLQYSRISTVINAIEIYLEMGIEGPDEDEHNPEKLKTLRSYWRDYGFIIPENEKIDRTFSASLKHSGWSWDSVYKLNKDN